MTVMDQVRLERIQLQAREMRPLRSLLTLIAGLFWLIGWCAAKVLLLVWAGITWCAAAVKVGWLDCRAAGKREDRV